MASSSARRASRSSVEGVEDARSEVDWASGERNLSAMAESLEGLVLDRARQPHTGFTSSATWS